MNYLLISAMLFSLFGCSGANGINLEGAFRYYEYQSSTMRAYPYEYYRLECSEDGALTLSWSKVSSDLTVLRVPDDAAREAVSIIEQYRLTGLKSSYRPVGRVLDGTMWHVYFTVGEKDISCNGENAWPAERQRKGIEAMNAYFNTLIEAAKEEDILEVKDFRSR